MAVDIETIDDVEQLTLLPNDPLTYDYQPIPLAMLPPNTNPTFSGCVLGESFVRSIKAFGVKDPITLIERPDGAWHIEDGRRRVLAARRIGLESIPARIARGEVVEGALAIIGNEQRSENIYGLLTAVESLLEQGYSEKDVAANLGLPMRRLADVLRFRVLVPEVRAAWAAGKLSKSVARAITKLSPDEQTGLMIPMANTGKITLDDVRDIRSATRAQTVESANFELDLKLDEVEASEPDELSLLRAELLDALASALDESGALRTDNIESTARAPLLMSAKIILGRYCEMKGQGDMLRNVAGHLDRELATTIKSLESSPSWGKAQKGLVYGLAACALMRGDADGNDNRSG